MSDDDRVQGRLSRSPAVEASAVGDRVVLYHRDACNALVLNPMATWLWSLLRVPRADGELVAEILAQFPAVSEDRARADLASLVAELLRQGFVTREP